jgi:hypothetical protein
MPDADVALAPTTPWTLRLFARASVSPFWVGLVISAVWFAFYLLYMTVLVDGQDRRWPSELGWSLIIGMAPAVTAASLRGSARDLEDLAPALRVSPAEFEGLRREIATVPRTLLTAVGVGTAVLTAIAVFHEIFMDTGRFPALGDPRTVWYIGRNVVNFWLISRALTIELSLARAFSHLGARLPAVDVVDRTPLAPFGRRGLRSVLLWMLYLSLFSWQYVLGAARPELGAALLVVASFAVAAFLLPVWGAHLRLREAKAAELSRVRTKIGEVRERALTAPAENVVGGRLADLVAWEQRIVSGGEWPLSGSTVLRFGLYTAIGLGSWLGAAFVERLLESALG